MVSCRIWFSAPSFWMGGGLESRCVGRVYGADVAVRHTPHTRPAQRLSRPPPIQKLGAENHILQINIWCSWWWAYVHETCRARNTLIKLPCCVRLAFQIMSWGRCAFKQTSSKFFMSMSDKIIFPMHANFILDVWSSKTPINFSHTLWKDRSLTMKYFGNLLFWLPSQQTK